MRVFRVAHSSLTSQVGTQDVPAGPYATREVRDRCRALAGMHWAHGDGSHPSPVWCHILNGIDPSEVCAFDSMESLLNWFADWHRALVTDGFEVFVYDVPDDKVRVGTFGQALFVYSSAVLADRFPIPVENTQLTLWGTSSPDSE